MERDTIKIYEITSIKEWEDFLNQVNTIFHVSRLGEFNSFEHRYINGDRN